MNDIFRKIARVVDINKYKATNVAKHGDIMEVDSWAISEILLKKVIPVIDVHPYPLNEQMLMASAVAFVQPKIIVEWGTHYGKSARLFWEISKALHLNIEVHTVDLMDPNHPEFPGSARGKYLGSTTVKQHVGDGYEVAMSLLKENKQPALIYIDGDHSKESVKKDLTIWNELPSGSGVLAHDVFYQNPTNYNIGPYQSIQEFLIEQKDTISQVQWQLLGLPGMFFASKK